MTTAVLTRRRGPYRKVPTESRFWPKVQKTDTCWLWLGARTGNGYGAFRNEIGKSVRAHRFSAGNPPEGLVWDHTCRVRHCVNPAHLEAVTQAENIRRGHRRRARGVTHGQ